MTVLSSSLPAWSAHMRDLFRSGAVSQFLLHGNVFDLVPNGDQLLSLKAFLDEVMFGSYDTVLHYDRSRGVRATRGNDDWSAWLRQALGDANPISSTREPGVALELVDRYLLRTLNLAAIQAAAPAADAPPPSRPAAESPSPPVAQSPSRPAAQSPPSRPVAQSPSRPVAQSPSPPDV